MSNDVESDRIGSGSESASLSEEESDRDMDTRVDNVSMCLLKVILGDITLDKDTLGIYMANNNKHSVPSAKYLDRFAPKSQKNARTRKAEEPSAVRLVTISFSALDSVG